MYPLTFEMLPIAEQKALRFRTPVGVTADVVVEVVVHPESGVQFSESPTNLHTRHALDCVVMIV